MATQANDGTSSSDDPRTVVEIEGRYYILATSSAADVTDRVLKQGDSFAVFGRHGDIRPIGLGEGIYHRGTRFLSGLASRSTVRSACVGCGPRIRAAACSPASCGRIGRRARRTTCSATIFSGWGFEHWRRASRAVAPGLYRLEVDAPERTLRFNHARLPVLLDHLRIENLAVGDASVDLLLGRQPQRMSVDVISLRGNVEVVTIK